MGEDKKEINSLKCTSCGGPLAKSSGAFYDEDEEEISIPVARCVQCNTVYDRHTKEYYAVFADDLGIDRDSTIFRPGLRGKFRGVGYEIIGRLRYQDEDEYEKATWDEWVALSGDGSYHYFVEEGGRIYSCPEYLPESIDVESGSDYIVFEGRRIKKSLGYNARLVFAEGELPWKAAIGEAVLCYDFKKGGNHYTIEISDGEVFITGMELLTLREVIEAFDIEDFKELYRQALGKRTSLLRESRIYLAGMLISFILSVYSCAGGYAVRGVMNTKNVLADNLIFHDGAGDIYCSQVLYGPFEISEGNALYSAGFAVDENVQDFNLEWQSVRMMLVSERRLEDAVKGGSNDAAPLRELFGEIDAMPEPVESFSVTGDFWDEEGRDSGGYWHESELSFSDDFVLDEAGKYYVYLELYNDRVRRPESVKVEISRVRGYRYYVIVFSAFFILWGICMVRSRSYNKLQFELAGK